MQEPAAKNETTTGQPPETDTDRGAPSPWKRFVANLFEIATHKDSPPRIAMGMGLGIFIGILPIMGIQMAVVSLLAIPFRANLKTALAAVWISNPITFLPMYYANYRFGVIFTPTREINRARFHKLLSTAAEWDWSEMGDSFMRILEIGSDILIPLWLGSFILATLLSVPTYFATLKLVGSYRKPG